MMALGTFVVVVLGYCHGQRFVPCVDLCVHGQYMVISSLSPSLCASVWCCLLRLLRARGLGLFNSPLSPLLILERSTRTAFLFSFVPCFLSYPFLSSFSSLFSPSFSPPLPSLCPSTLHQKSSHVSDDVVAALLSHKHNPTRAQTKLCFVWWCVSLSSFPLPFFFTFFPFPSPFNLTLYPFAWFFVAP